MDVAVEQVDRVIAAAILEGPPWRHDRIAAMVRSGGADDNQLVRAAATSRLAARTEMAAEVERLREIIRMFIWAHETGNAISDEEIRRARLAGESDG